MSSAIPKALFSIGVNAPAVDARLQSPSESNPGSPSSFEYLGNNVFGGYSDVIRYESTNCYSIIFYMYFFNKTDNHICNNSISLTKSLLSSFKLIDQLKRFNNNIFFCVLFGYPLLCRWQINKQDIKNYNVQRLTWTKYKILTMDKLCTQIKLQEQANQMAGIIPNVNRKCQIPKSRY